MIGKIEISDLSLEYIINKVFLRRTTIICTCGEIIENSTDKDEIKKHIQHLLDTDLLDTV